MMSVSPLTASSESARVYYRGAWTPVEHDAIESVVAQVEASRPSCNSVIGKPWVCLRVAVGATSVYLAHRIGEGQVFKAKSARDLADQIARGRATVRHEAAAV